MGNRGLLSLLGVVAATFGSLPAASAGGHFSAGWLHTCEVRANGGVACSGYNRYGQIGDNTTTDRLIPTPVKNLSGVAAVSAGFLHTCSVHDNGTVKCWGDNGPGTLGDGTTVDRLTPVSVSISGVIDVAAGSSHTCALRGDGSVYCWGSNYSGQIGIGGTTAIYKTPMRVTGISDAIAISSKDSHTCVLHADSTVSCWGQNGMGQLGDGTLTTRNLPTRVPGLVDVVQVEAGGGHTCALSIDGTMKCWGWNHFGQLGDSVSYHEKYSYYCGGTIFDPDYCTVPVDVGDKTNPTPTDVIGLMGITHISIGSIHSCAVVADGTVSCWGGNSTGQLGDGTIVPRSIPGPAALPPVTSLASGWNHNCATLADATVVCWGTNNKGEAGNGRTSPIRTGGYYFSPLAEPSQFQPF